MSLCNIIHGPEFWLAWSIFLVGFGVGIIFWGIIGWLAERNNKHDKR